MPALSSSRNIKTGTLLWSPRTATFTLSTVSAGDAPWTVVNDDTVWKRPSSSPGSVKFTVGVGTTIPAYQVRAPLLTAITPNQLHSIQIPLYRENPNGGTYTVRVVLRNAALTDGYAWDFTFPTVLQQPRVGIFAVGLKTVPTSTIGSPTGTTSLTDLELQVYCTATNTGSFYVGPLYANWYSKPQIVFTIDDGYTGDYDNAYVYMKTKGLVGSCAINSAAIGAGGRLTITQLQTMVANGWSIHNHARTHEDLVAVTEAEARTAIELNRDWLKQYGLHASGDRCFVLPFGNNSVAVENIVDDYYEYSAVAAQGALSTWDGIPDTKLIFRLHHDVPTSSSTIITAINTAVLEGRSLVLYGHNVNTGTPGGTYTAMSTFTPIVDHVYNLVRAGLVDNVNLQTFVKGRGVNGARRSRY